MTEGSTGSIDAIASVDQRSELLPHLMNRFGGVHALVAKPTVESLEVLFCTVRTLLRSVVHGALRLDDELAIGVLPKLPEYLVEFWV